MLHSEVDRSDGNMRRFEQDGRHLRWERKSFVMNIFLISKTSDTRADVFTWDGTNADEETPNSETWLWSTQAKSKRIAVFWSWCGDVSEVSSAVWDDLLFWKPTSLFPPDVLFPPPLASKVCSSTYISWDKQSPTQCSSLQCERLPCAFKGWNQWNSPLNTTKHCFKWQGVILQTPIQPFCHIETLIEWKRC